MLLFRLLLWLTRKVFAVPSALISDTTDFCTISVGYCQCLATHPFLTGMAPPAVANVSLFSVMTSYHATTAPLFINQSVQEEQREMLVECCPYLENVIPRSLAAAADPSPPPPPLPRAPPPMSGRTTAGQDSSGWGAGTPATSGGAAPDAQSTAAVGVSVEAAGKSSGGDGSKREVSDEQNAEKVSRNGTGGGRGGGGDGGGSGTAVTAVLSLEPLGDVEAEAAAAAVAGAAAASTSPARKKPKVVQEGAVAVDRSDAGQVQGVAD